MGEGEWTMKKYELTNKVGFLYTYEVTSGIISARVEIFAKNLQESVRILKWLSPDATEENIDVEGWD
jgi:hypothetical protein